MKAQSSNPERLIPQQGMSDVTDIAGQPATGRE
jgi:hypothetical protein